MSFPPATEMVQFAGFASSSYGFTEGYPLKGGLPHSEISGSKGARPSPELFAACHVLHRLSVPRHPPDALLSSSPTPSPKHAAAATAAAVVRGRMADVSRRPRPAGRPGSLAVGILHPSSDRGSVLLEPNAKSRSRRDDLPRRLDYIPMPRRAPADPTPGRHGSRLLHGHNSLHDVIRTRERNGGRRPTGRSCAHRHVSRFPDQNRRVGACV